MRRYVIEEAFELIEGIDEDDGESIQEELGDVFLISGMLSVIAEEDGRFSVADVFNGISDKLVRRHPHVFGSSEASTAGAVEAQWEEIKKEEKRAGGHDAAVWDPGVTRSVPALERARRVQKSAAKEGFDWPESWGPGPIVKKIREETSELEEQLEGRQGASTAGNARAAEEELGDLLFSVVNLSRRLRIDPSLALSCAIDKFEGRFGYVHQELKRRNVSDPKIDELDALWKSAKRRS